MKFRMAVVALHLAACAAPATNRLKDGAAATEGDVTEFGIHGMVVLVKNLPHEPVTSCELYLRGGVRNWDAAHAGVERLALTAAASGGTALLPKAEFQRRLAELGVQLGADSSEDFGVMAFKALDRNFEQAFALLADAFLHPALPDSEIELQRQLMLSELRQEDENPDAALGKAVHELLYRGLPYARRAVGTPASVAALSRADLISQLALLRETSRLVLVVVGNVTPARVAALARQAFGQLPTGNYADERLAGPTPKTPHAELVERPLPTHYVLGAFPAPTWGDPGFAAGVVAMSSLREKLFEEVRTKRDLSYAPGAGLSLHGLGEGYLYVTAVDAQKTMSVMLDVLRQYQAAPLDAERLEGDKRVFLTNFLLQNESTGGQADLLARAELDGGNWRLARDLPDQVKRVQPADVTAFLTRYARNLQVVVLGKDDQLSKAAFEGM